METQKQEVFALKWETKELENMRKKNNDKFILILFVVLFGFVPLLFSFLETKLTIIITLILMFLLVVGYYLDNKKLKHKFGSVAEFYKINEEGISVNKTKEGMNSFYRWSDLDSYYSSEKALSAIGPFAGPFSKLFTCDNFTITDKNGKSFNLRVNDDIKSEVELILSKHLKLWKPINNLLNTN